VSVATETRLDAAIEAATARLLELQHPDGYWVGELESNVTMTAQHLFWHHVLGLRTPELDRKIANELLARQHDDGTWAIWFEGPGDLSTTVEAYAALELAGVDPGPQAREFIRSRGGIAKTRIFTKCFLALLGQWPWQRVTPIPVELVLFPPSAPFSIYNFSCWARGTFVPLAACRALRPVRYADIDLREIGARPSKTRAPAPPGPLRRAALHEAERWVRSHQEADGSWGGIQPPWVWSILMLVALGHGFEDETLRRAVEGWEGFVIDEGGRLRPEACQSPVWDTGLAVLALRDSGLGPEHPALVQAADWLEHEEVTVPGDWAVRRPELAPADQGDVFGGRDQGLEPGHVEVEVLVVQMAEQAFLGQVPQPVEVHHVPGVRVDFALYGKLELVVVPVEVCIAAFAERLPVPLFGKPRIEQAVRGIEMHAAGDGTARHGGARYWLLAIGWIIEPMEYKLLGSGSSE
jgi:squalene-hopene/tetraprenyl-beta-curcumene cyclase